MHFASLVSFITLSSLVFAHPGEHEEISVHEFAVRSLAAQGRHLQARNCAASFAASLEARKAKRNALRKRTARQRRQASATSSAATPHYTTLQNTTCITAPDVVEGPYYINDEMVRTNLIEDQTGVQLVIDVGILDTTTCQPLPNAFVEIWSANATGVYGGYPGSSSSDASSAVSDNSTTTATNSSLPVSMSMSMPVAPSGTDSFSAAMPSGSGAPGGGIGGGDGTAGASTALSRNDTWLRGGYFTDDAGIVELTTIYPGFYTGRTAHVHTMVHLDWVENANGTLASQAGTLIHIGQFFFEESWNDEVFATAPYSSNNQTRTLNVDDTILTSQNADGNNAYLSLELLGDTIEDGVLAYITLGVDTSKSLSISNTNYLNSSTTDSVTSTDILTSTTDSLTSTTDSLTSTTDIFTSTTDVLVATSSATSTSSCIEIDD